jgi:hypothetical protein
VAGCALYRLVAGNGLLLVRVVALERTVVVVIVVGLVVTSAVNSTLLMSLVASIPGVLDHHRLF